MSMGPPAEGCCHGDGTTPVDSGPVDEAVEPLGDRVGAHRPAVWVADEQPDIVVVVPKRLPFAVQRGQVAAQVSHRDRVEGYRARRPLSVLPSDS